VTISFERKISISPLHITSLLQVVREKYTKEWFLVNNLK
jgi:hypothetical protein